MSIKKRIAFNGKFLSASPTGVHRVAEELYVATLKLIDSDKELRNNLKVDLWIPSNAVARAEMQGFEYTVLPNATGILWEQLILPIHARRTTVLNLCNVGPVIHRNSITMFHDAQVHSSPTSYSWPFRLWYHLHQPWAGRTNERILTVSEYSRQQLAHYKIAPLPKIDVVHNGVDHMRRLVQDDTIVDKLGLLDRKFVLGLANVQTHKNIGLLFKAIADPRLADLTLVLFGGADRGAFEKLGMTVPANVCFAGKVSDADLAGLVRHAVALCFPSLTEGFGLPPLEAMALGCPAIVAPNGALPEVCGPDTIYAPADQPTAWVDAIRALADSADYWNDQSRKSRIWADSFTWEKSAQALVASVLKAA